MCGTVSFSVWLFCPAHSRPPYDRTRYPERLQFTPHALLRTKKYCAKWEYFLSIFLSTSLPSSLAFLSFSLFLTICSLSITHLHFTSVPCLSLKVVVQRGGWLRACAHATASFGGARWRETRGTHHIGETE